MTLLGVGRIGGRRARGEEGQALVEIALVMPFLLLLLTAIIQFGFVYEKYLTLTDAVRSGAQTLALGRALTDPCDPAVKQTVADADGLINSGAVTISLTSPDTCGTGSYPNRTGGSETSGNKVTVSATDPYNLTVFGFGVWTLNLSASASDAVQ